MECVPAARVVVVKLAVAVVVEPVTSAEPRVVVPSRKVTVPVGVPEVSVTEAVRVTLALRVQVVPEEVGVWVDGGVGLRARGDVDEMIVDGRADDGVEEGVGIELEDMQGLAGIGCGDSGEQCG
jgi:hypothetical protein